MKKSNLLFFLLVLLGSLQVVGQQDGYWDKERTTSKQIVVAAGKRVMIKSEDFPIGTTEVVYRITLLDENQQLATSLFSLLKAIPDPTGISQGSAGAVLLLSKVSGEDKCNYAIFTTEKAALDFKTTGKMEKACLAQTTPVAKDAKLISFDKSACFTANSTNLWFAFESKNWVMNQKIIIEIVPWVDSKLSRGWNQDNKKAIIALCKTSDLVKKMLHPDDFCVCMLEKFQNKYKFKEYEKLLAAEKTKAFKDFGYACLTEKPINKAVVASIRLDANQYFNTKKYSEAIDLLTIGVIDNGNAQVADYNALGTYYLYSKQYDKAIKALKIGEKLDDSELLLQLNLAHAYLLNDNYSAAKELHKKFRTQNVTANLSWKVKATNDIESFRKAGIANSDFDRIIKLLED